MKHLRRAFTILTRWLCPRWPVNGPRGASCSGYAWNLEQRGCLVGRFWRLRIDGALLFLWGEQDHCRASWAKDIEAATGTDKDRLITADMMARDHQTTVALAAALRPPMPPVVPYFVDEDDVQEGAP